MSSHDDPRIEVGSAQIASTWSDEINAVPPRWGTAMLHGIANHFENSMTENWPRMAKEIRTSLARGLSDSHNATKVSTFKMAGRVLITLSQWTGRRDDQITFLSYEHDDDEWWGASVQSIEAPLSTVLEMIADVSSAPIILEPDKDVRIGGL